MLEFAAGTKQSSHHSIVIQIQDFSDLLPTKPAYNLEQQGLPVFTLKSVDRIVQQLPIHAVVGFYVVVLCDRLSFYIDQFRAISLIKPRILPAQNRK